MDTLARGDPLTRAANEHGSSVDHLELSLELITERMLLSALREQDAADAATAAQWRAQFLADIGQRLGESLDREITYAAIAGLALPGRDAWCVVDIVEVGGRLRRLDIVHPDKDQRHAARALLDRWVPAPDDPIGVPVVARDRRPVIVDDQVEATVAAAARDPETLLVLESLGAGSLLIVPMIAHGVLVGAITFVSRSDAPAYQAEDVVLAEAIAARCAQALERARLYATACILRDEADRARAEADRARADADRARADADTARATAETANASKVQFLRMVSHELRTPLNAIGGYAQLMELGIRGPVTVHQLADLVSIQRAQHHLLGLVESVLNYAQIEVGRMTYAIDDIPFVEIVEASYLLVAPQMIDRNLTYRFEGGDRSLLARTDPEKLRQIILNLLSNAAKFTPVDGTITMTCGAIPSGVTAGGEPIPEMVTVRVTNTGIDIPADKIEMIFEPFVQVGRRLTSSNGGVGLGLAISRDLARAMGGDLKVESGASEGCTFTLTLPAA